MAKKTPEIKNNIEVRCDYCLHNKGENKEFRYMWHCSHLTHCVVFGLRFCKASSEGKGEFVLDNQKYNVWKNNQSSAQ